MKRTIMALASAAMVAAAMSSPAQAGCRGCAVGAGIIGGLAAGAIIGSAIANSQPRYYEPAPVYVAPPPARAMCITMAMRNVIRSTARAAAGCVGRLPSMPMANRSAGAALASSARKDRLTALGA